MEEFGRINWLAGTYEEFLDNIDNIPVGSICFCTNVGKLFVKVEDNKLEEQSEEDFRE